MENFNKFPDVAKALDAAVVQAVKKTAFDLQGNMQKQMRANGQVDTGFMIGSVYVRTADESTYNQIGTASAKSVKGTKKKLKKASPAKPVTPLPEVEQPPDNKTAYVGVAAPYGWVQNYGSHKMAARPFLEPAVERVQPAFEKALGKIADKMKEAAS